MTTYHRRWHGLAILTLPVLLTSMDISILHMAVPSITSELAPSAGQTLWILDAYGFLLAGLLIVMGNVGDRIGRRRLLLIGAAMFAAASLLAAFAPDPGWLIAARALMGVGGATLMPSTLSLIRNMFTDPGERTRAIGLWTASLAGGVALGPVVGGLLLEVFWWGSVFLINVPLIAVLLILAPIMVPEYRSPDPSKLDLISVALSFGAILPVVWAAKTAAEELAVTVPVGSALAVGLTAGIAFVARQRSATLPLVDVRLFGKPEFVGAVVGGCLAMFSLVGLMLFNSQYLQLVLDLSPFVAAMWILPVMLAVGGMSVAASIMVRRIGYAPVFGVGALVASAGMFLFASVPVDGGLTRSVIACVLVGAGIAPMMTLATDIVVSTVPPQRSGAASALSETANELGAALGIAVLGAIGGAAYRAEVTAGLPDDVPAEAVEAGSSSLGAALALAEYLPPGSAAQLTLLARQAFVDGLEMAAGIGSAILAATAVLCFTLLRRRPADRRPVVAADG